MRSNLPKFSIVIPTFARPTRLKACLSAVARLDYPREHVEVVVVDDGSPTPIDHAVHETSGKLDLRLQRQPNAGPAAARNAGARLAKGTFIAFLDDDCTPEPQWLAALADVCAAKPDYLVGGRTINALPNNPFATATDLLAHYFTRQANRPVSSPERGSGAAPFFPSNNLCVARQRFLDAGGFDESFPLAAGEDREFCYRWHCLGGSLCAAPEAVARHAHDLNLGGFWRQHFNYGRGAARFHRRTGAHTALRRPPAPLSFYLGLLGCPLAEDFGPRAWLHASLIGVSQLANAAGFVRETRLMREEGRS